MNTNENPLITSSQLATPITENMRIASDVDDALKELQSILKRAAEFVQRRPIVALATACVLGMMGTWAVSARNRKEV